MAMPMQVTRLVPASAMVVDEKSWITYPFMRTVITIPFFSKVGPYDLRGRKAPKRSPMGGDFRRLHALSTSMVLSQL